MSQDPILCVSYFDHVIGLSKLYCSEPLADVVGAPGLNRILEFNEEEGTFIFTYRKFQTLNHLFFIDSKFARGGKDLLMITFMIKTTFFKKEIVNVHKYLDSKTPILEDFAEDIKRLNGLTSLLHLKKSLNSDENVLNFADKELKALFLEIFNRYFKKLTGKMPSLMKVESPLILVIAEEPDILNLTNKFLTLGDFETITSSNATEALKILEERYNEISIVLLDIMMPDQFPYTLLEEIKHNDKYKHIRVVFIPYPYIFKPPTPPGDIGLVDQLQARKSNVKETEHVPYCKFCGGILVKGEYICHVCGNKVI